MAVLGREAEAAQSAGRAMKAAVANLGDIGWLEGYVVDAANADVVLVGRRGAGRPALKLDDLIVALRNVWGGQAYPFCSLDPRPQDVVKVRQILAEGKAPGDIQQRRQVMDRLKKAWGPQTVRVGGVPRDSRHAHIMIDADYHMKKVAQGLEEVPGVTGSLDRSLAEAKRAFEAGREPGRSGVAVSRFWFHVREGCPTFTEGDGQVWLAECPVMVLTERQKATADGQLHDAGGDDPDAKAFAQELSARFADAAARVAAYAELEDLFRLGALVRALRLKDAPAGAGLDLGFYLQRYQYQSEKPMPASMPGLANHKEWYGESVRGDTVYQCWFWPMVCGGVSMEMACGPGQFSRGPARTDALALAVLRARPHKDALSWTVAP
jgi:hypothetical protein